MRCHARANNPPSLPIHGLRFPNSPCRDSRRSHTSAISHVHMSDSTALDSFLDKWRARWPEWQMAEVFVPPARRAIAVAWFALLQEFEDAMNIAGDPMPADAK